MLVTTEPSLISISFQRNIYHSVGEEPEFDPWISCTRMGCPCSPSAQEAGTGGTPGLLAGQTSTNSKNTAPSEEPCLKK